MQSNIVIFVAIVCGVSAVFIGAWRQACDIYERMLPWNCPRIWKNWGVQMFTWLIVALLSIVFSTVMATLIVLNIGDFIGRFSFGVLLVLRWHVSTLIGGVPATRKIEKLLDDDSDDVRL